MDGTGRGKKLADDVVDIIRSRGGTAVANYGECSQYSFNTDNMSMNKDSFIQILLRMVIKW